MGYVPGAEPVDRDSQAGRDPRSDENLAGALPPLRSTADLDAGRRREHVHDRLSFDAAGCDAYCKGIRGYDAEALYEAMKASANRDTFGYFLKAFRGTRYYKQYEYVPCDLEVTSVSKTLEYCYDDWCIAQMARMLGHRDDYDYYIGRAGWYKNLFDQNLNFMRGRNSDGSWRTPFDPFHSNHYRPDDDFCEGTSWQWTFFVPHDGKGLMNLFGGRDPFVAKLDSLFTVSSEIHGDNPAPDITGLIGQYAQGNEPGHHTLYMYNYAGQPWKGQKRISDVIYTLYDTSPEGICGNDDTGQMSAWYVMSSMGFYPVTHGRGVYFIGTPIFGEMSVKHPNGVLTIRANGVSRENCYIQSVTLNGAPYSKNWLRHEDLFGGNATLAFEMGPEPNKNWGSSPEDLPQSMCDETFEN
ncbi:glycoside hydrolase family 92 protein [Alistipes sp. AF48-12]|nr:glycoside hydrolase family 92 protein [Alistipes sp. AF48-12]